MALPPYYWMLLATVPLPDDRVAAAARGDRAAAEAVCRALAPRVRNLVRYLVRGDRHVDDLAQDALIAVLRGLGSFRGDGRFEAWADRVVARATFAGLRKLRAAEPSDDAVDARAPDDDRGDAYVLRRQVVAHLDTLPAEQREAVALHFAAGMTVPEIAELTGAPFETVRSRIRLGKAALRAALGGTDG